MVLLILGKRCQTYDDKFPGGTWRESVEESVLTHYDKEKENEKCILQRCMEKANNFRCDPECNTLECKFDAGDCSYKKDNPWEKCKEEEYCYKVFKNGKCDLECNNAGCLFDGRDCETDVETCK